MRARLDTQQTAKCAQRFGDAFIRFEESEDAHQRRGFIDAQPVAKRIAVRLRNPGAVRNVGDRSAETGCTHFVHHELAVDYHAEGGFEHAAGHADAFVIRPHFERAHAERIIQRFLAAFVFALAEIGVPIVAADGEVRNQVMQVRFVHHHHAGMPQRRFVNEIVIGIVPQVIQRYIEF